MPSRLAKSFTILRGLVYSAAFVWLWTWVALTVRPFDARLAVALPLWLRPVGYVVGGAGAVVAALCIATFVTRGRGTPAPFDPPRDFVASGPYRYVRNPMYVGAAAVIRRGPHRGLACDRPPRPRVSRHHAPLRRAL